MVSNADHLVKKVDLTIVQDWNKVEQGYSKILAMKDSGKFDEERHFVEEYHNIQYNIKHFGVLSVDNNISKDWNVWSGPLLNSMLPWYNHAKTIFADLNFFGVIYSVTPEGIKLHVDNKRDSEKHLGQCKLNYIISSEDQTALTNVYDKDDKSICASYPSTPGSAWLLDTNHPHELINSGYRIMVQFKFFNDFATVSKFLDQYGPIVLKD